MKNLDECNHSNISSNLGMSTNVSGLEDLISRTVGNHALTFLQFTHNLFNSCIGEPGGHFLGTVTIGEI